MTAPFIVAISGATGAIYGIETLRILKELGLPAHLIISEMGQRTIEIETSLNSKDVRALAEETYNNKDLGAAVASGSFLARGMIVAPCSIKTLSGIAHSFSYNLIIRAADVTMKEGRPLVLMVRETPLHKGHLELMAKAADVGATIYPPVPAFYHQPKTIEDIVRQSVCRALDHLGIEHDLLDRWKGG
ncbi:MAG: UbiX family flavin prenyltransferase [Proteobacteria bacterium]|nr:UbiX family flavin prenyltransferase [Pseudomonadota bacterium]MDA1024059.1 UbiX family flavin prenyltransferase [Pseudomonadota bacterium]